MSGDFNWWLLILGVAVGGALTWLVLGDSRRREEEIGEEELTAEAGWIARTLHEGPLDTGQVEQVLRAHRRYISFAPPDVLVDPTELAARADEPSPNGDPKAAG